VAVSGSVSVPKGKAPKGGWPVISYAHGTTGVADSCAPSRVTASSPVAGYVNYINPEFEDWIDAGYAVVRTDYQGLGTPGDHPYLVGSAEGRGVLDIVSAARQLDPDIGKSYLIAGHSQGGHAALFAAGEANDYSPQLKLKGTVAYAPASHLLEQAEALPALTTPSSLSALAALIVKGASTVTPTVNVPQLLNDEPLALFPQVDQTCLPQLGASDSFGGIAPSDLIRDGADTGPLYGVLETENPDVKTKAPVLLAQGTADTTVFKVFTDELNDELTAAGDDVTYKVFDGVTHGEIPAAAEDDALAFFKKRLPPRG
jgi:pimeloyl-ACP methyl ester carboxylesterase